MFLFIHKYFLPAGRKQSYFIEMILTDNSERLNSMIAGRKICRIKFHRGVEFKFAIKQHWGKAYLYKKAVDEWKNYAIIIVSAVKYYPNSWMCTICNWREVRCETMSNVIVKENETLDSALRRFKRNCAKAGIQQEIRKREHYEKPSVRRKKKSEAARKRKYN